MATRVTRLAKLVAPKSRRPVIRERLFAMLDAPAEAVWIYGPPGAGKTTLITSYLETRDIPPLWYQVDSDDREPSTFFHFLAEATAGIETQRTALPAIDADTRVDWPAYARRFARALAASLPARCALVFDNVHEGGAPLEKILAVIAGELNEGQRLYATSYQPPHESFAAMQAKRQLVVLTPDVLRFESGETADLAKVVGLSRPEEIERVHSFTSGWAAGIVLLASQPGAGLPTEPEDQWQMLDYMSRSVLNWIPAQARHVVERCAFFPDFDVALACAASGDPGAGKLIAALYQDGFFVERRGTDNTASYRLHTVLAEALRNRVGPRGSPARRQAEAAAGGMLLMAGRIEAAITLLLAGGAYEQAAPRIQEIAKQMVATGREEQLANWIAALPAADLEAQPWLNYWQAIATASFDEQKARLVFAQVYERFQARGDRLGMALSAAAALSAIYAGWRSFEGMERWARMLKDSWTDDLVFPDGETELRAIIGMIVAVSSCGLRRENFDQYVLATAGPLIEGTDDDNLRLQAGDAVLTYLYSIDAHEPALALSDQIERLVDFDHAHPMRVATWKFTIFRHDTYVGEIMHRPDLSERALRRREACNEWADRHAIPTIKIALAHIDSDAALLNDDLAASTAALDSVEALLTPRMTRHTIWHNHRRAKIFMRLGQFNKALASTRQVLTLVDEAKYPAHLASIYQNNAALCLASLHQFDEALALLKIVIEHSSPGPKRQYTLTSLLLKAIQSIHAKREQANADIHSFLAEWRKAKLPSYGHLVLPQLSYLCNEALRRGIDTEIAKELVSVKNLVPPEGAAIEWPWPVKIHALGQFQVFRGGTPLSFEGKMQKRPMEMLKFLIARSDPLKPNKGVSIQELLDELWPSANTKDPKSSFDITLHRLRKLLEKNDALAIAEGRLILDRRLVWCDAFQFESSAVRAADSSQAELEATIALYKGRLFDGKTEAPWAFSATERLAARFVSLVERLGGLLEEKSDWDGALAVYERGVAQDNLVERFYRGVMRCRLARGEPQEALRAYRRCREYLSIVLGLNPAPETEELRLKIKSQAV